MLFLVDSLVWCLPSHLFFCRFTYSIHLFQEDQLSSRITLLIFLIITIAFIK